MSELAGRVAIVTGGSRGIGRGIALELARAGMRVAVSARTRSEVEETAREAGGLAVEADVSREDDVARMVAEVERGLGPIDLLVNNAGGDRTALFVDTDEDDWDHSLALNLRGTLACTHAVLPGMCERGRGVIVNVASEAGRMGMPAGAVYSAAKAGVIGFTKAIARETAHLGIRCNAVAPGAVDTPLLEGTPMRRQMVAATLIGRPGTPDEVAATIAFLASDEAALFTGQTLAPSGGTSMW